MTSRANSSSLLVLVVDDSSTLRKLIEIALRGTRCEVAFAATGAEAIALANARPPNVILLDYLLPDLRSSEVCARLQENPATVNIPIVVMSANQRTIMSEFSQFPMVVDFVGKPFTAPVVRERLEAALQSRDPAAPVPLASTASGKARTSTATVLNSGLLELAGAFGTITLLDTLRYLSNAQATGVLVLKDNSTSRIWMRKGDVVLCSHAEVDWLSVGRLTNDVLPPNVRQLVVNNQLEGKPAHVTLVEHGFAEASNLPMALTRTSSSLLATLAESKTASFQWQGLAVLPDFVEAFGRPITATAAALTILRANLSNSGTVEDSPFERKPQFSKKLEGAQLTSEEQRVLGLVDGVSSAWQISDRAKMPAVKVMAILSRLAAADLLVQLSPASPQQRIIGVVGAGDDGFVEMVQSWFTYCSIPAQLEQFEIKHGLPPALFKQQRCSVVMGETALCSVTLRTDFSTLVAAGDVTMVALLDRPSPSRAARFLQLGFHSVIAKPVTHLQLQRVLSL
jgi:CheY-like chemotaxis protein